MAWLDVTFQFRNDGDEPLIVIEPNDLIFEKKVYWGTSAHVNPSITAETLTYNPYKPEDPFSTVINPEDHDYRPGLYRSVSKKPRVIMPGAFHEFHGILLLANGFKFDEKLVKEKPSGCEDADAPVPQYQTLSVEYRLSSKKAPEANDSFFRDLSARWKSSGRLVLDGGDIAYKSQNIILESK